MKLLVAGAAGFIGSAVMDLAEDRGHHAVGLDFRSPIWSSGPRYIVGDVLDSELLREIFARESFDIVINLAGRLGTAESLEHAAEFVQSNVMGTLNLLDVAREQGVRFLGVDTGPDWPSPYSISKRTAAEFARAYTHWHSVPTCTLKIFNAFGPRQSGTRDVNKIVPRFAINALSGEPLPIFGSGLQKVDLVHVDDCATALVLAAERAPFKGETIEIGTGFGQAVSDVAQKIIEIVGSGSINYLPARRGEGTTYPVADIQMSKSILGFTPFFTDEQLIDTVRWYEEHPVDEWDFDRPSATS